MAVSRLLDFLSHPPTFPTLHEWHQVLPSAVPARLRAHTAAPKKRPGYHGGVPPFGTTHHSGSDTEAAAHWTVADWLYWFDPASDEDHSWCWWDSGVLDHDDHFWSDVDGLEDPAALATLNGSYAPARPRSTSTTKRRVAQTVVPHQPNVHTLALSRLSRPATTSKPRKSRGLPAENVKDSTRAVSGFATRNGRIL
jgi:hypothetical protein